jgi:hypothetical protein
LTTVGLESPEITHIEPYVLSFSPNAPSSLTNYSAYVWGITILSLREEMKNPNDPTQELGVLEARPV